MSIVLGNRRPGAAWDQGRPIRGSQRKRASLHNWDRFRFEPGGTLSCGERAGKPQKIPQHQDRTHQEGASRHQTQLRSIDFRCGELSIKGIEGIEQHPTTNSRWAGLAREGKRIMQFRCKGRDVTNVCEVRLLRYPAWNGKGLP
jgi:hypothetical protein